MPFQVSALRRAATSLSVLLLGLTPLAAAPVTSCTPGAPSAKPQPPEVEPDPALPGVPYASPQLSAQLAALLAAKGKAYRPRAEHLTPDGSPQFTNRLIGETSPYLLQHAHNPVNWYPWGNEAFERAKREHKPVLLSVGYSTCHWCHVMEHESFEDVEIATFINQHFIPIKVDREERPDVDGVYMSAVYLLAGSGGWPMTVLLTPERDPFFAGTYFPARDGDRGARKGLLSILRELSDKFRKEPKAVVAEAKQLSQRMQASAQPAPPSSVPGAGVIARAAQGMAQSFDPVWGGFGRAPKFPRPAALELLLRYHRRTGDPQALHMVTLTLERMARGGMYDHVAGGFHRYSTDQRWLVPHFEKMLYDNAQLVSLYVAAYQLTQREDFAALIKQTLAYISREMTAPGGGFYSATDADSIGPSGHAEEGYYFTWTPEELRRVLGREQARLAGLVFLVTPGGNFEGRSVLQRRASDAAVAKQLKLTERELAAELDSVRGKLLAARNKRPPPLRDGKLLVAWNGLMISAFARASQVLAEPSYASAGVAAAEFCWSKLRDPKSSDSAPRLFRSYIAGHAKQAGFLEDYAFLAQGYLDVFEATGDLKWLTRAIALQAALQELFADPKAGGYFSSSGSHEALLTREKASYDGAEPSGNSVALLSALRLGELTSDAKYTKQAERGFAAFGSQLTRSPGSSPLMLCALDHYLDAPREVVLIAGEDVEGAGRLERTIAESYLPNRVFLRISGDAPSAGAVKLVPLLDGKLARKGKATAYVCERGRCELPTSEPAQLKQQIGKVHPLVEPAPAPLR